MVKFGFYSKEDTTQEIYSSTTCSCIEEAAEIFSVKKNLSVDEFSKLYDVKILD